MILRKLNIGIFLLLYSAGFFFWADALAQVQQVHSHSGHTSIQLIEEAEANGNITKDQAIIQKLAVGLNSELLRPEFKTEDESTVKCMTPVVMEFYEMKDELQPQTVSAVEEMLFNFTASSESLEYISPSGRFKFFYETDGRNAVPLDDANGNSVPDYVEKAAVMADSSYSYQIKTLGFKDFYTGEPYEIYFRNFVNAYGQTRPSGSTTIIDIHNNFNSFPENNHPEGNQLGALYVTIAHELKHASQYVVNRWTGNYGSRDWTEMDATMMEEVVHPDVDDYYNYIMRYSDSNGWWDQSNAHPSSIFKRPNNPTPGQYWHVSWMLYFQEKFGIDFWVDVWDEISKDFQSVNSSSGELTFFDAINLVLQQRGAKLEQEHLSNHLWHLASGPFLSPIDFGFEDRENYPESTIKYSVGFVPETIKGDSLEPMAANYIDVKPSLALLGQPAVTVTGNVKGFGVGIIGYFKDGTADVRIRVSKDELSQRIQTTWDWADLTDIKVVVVNTNQDLKGSYELEVSSIIPDGVAITQNYPNPFNPTTQIGFSVDDRKDVKLEVYDTAGRKVQTLMDTELNRGFYTATFDGTGLASGVYFYRLVTGNSVLTKKMVLVK